MTDAELNKLVHEKIEGKCVQFTPYPVARHISPTGLSNVCKCGVHRGNHTIPNYLHDDAYVFRAIKKLLAKPYHAVITKFDDPKGDGLYWVETCIDNDSGKWNMVTDPFLNRAVLLAALKIGQNNEEN